MPTEVLISVPRQIVDVRRRVSFSLQNKPGEHRSTTGYFRKVYLQVRVPRNILKYLSIQKCRKSCLIAAYLFIEFTQKNIIFQFYNKNKYM